jgi:hypothetical protein
VPETASLVGNKKGEAKCSQKSALRLPLSAAIIKQAFGYQDFLIRFLKTYTINSHFKIPLLSERFSQKLKALLHEIIETRTVAFIDR